jgi:uncharacterized protein (TIGR03118 family)
VEPLEDRRVLSGNVLQTNLVSDLPGVAQVTDANLVNPWGISESGGSPFWISDNNAGVTTLYNTQGAPVPILRTVTQNFATIPAPNDLLGASGTPTGTVFNPSIAAGAFKISGVAADGTATSAPAIFLFVTEDGTIVGWNPGVNPSGFAAAKAGTYAILRLDNSPGGAVYKGLTVATSTGPIFNGDAASTTVLYAANFHSGQVEVYDSGFNPVTLPAGAFSDTNLPAGYAPFDVQELGGKIYVSYAKQNAEKHDDVAGEGHGFVDVFNLDGSPAGLTGPGGVVTPRLLSRGELNSPWGLALAPSSFGNLSGALLVGNFGDGRIHAYDPSTGKALGSLKDPDGEPIQIDGLWALKVGNGGNGGAADTVYFTAGLFGETHGLFGSLKPVAAGTPEGPAEAQMVTAALDVVQIDLNTLQTDIANGAPKATIRQDFKDLNAALVQLGQAEERFADDVRADDSGKGRNESAAHKHDQDLLDDLFTDLGGFARRLR